ncbi:MAG TPA: 1-deoxy-D-xylulose-5-phosphate reductoisomerase [Actinomycetota bacterium]|nr:1-deoxy-D-xylulose-5-phosphate reductoisomerase [Actinomycetota bacterium]
MSAPRNVVVLGSTGSIGRQALDVIASAPDRFRLIGAAAGRDEETLTAQAEAHRVPHVALGTEGAIDLAALDEADVVLNAIVGAAGLRASLAALGRGTTLALANKESLIAGGELCLAAARRTGASIIPVDSEHAALAQCLAGRAPDDVARAVLTASGGPFRRRDVLDDVTPEEALAHPTWSMGPKITVDCATLMNKGLEVIEAHFLFGLDYDRIGILVHPQSLVHALVELTDGSSILQVAPADMRIPIAAALAHPARLPISPPVDLADAGRLEFEPLDTDRFPAPRLAYEAGRRGGTFPAALNAANEEAVGAFLTGLLPFPGITEVVEGVLESHEGADATDLDEVLEVDAWARGEARRLVRERSAALRSDPGVIRRANRGAILDLPAPAGEER